MKKMLLTVVAVMALTTGFAQRGHHFMSANPESYDMTIDMRRLSAKLDLNSNQMDAVEVIHQIFSDEMSSAGSAKGGRERATLVRQAVGKDIHQMRRVLDDNQFHTYMMLLGTTLHNRGL